MKARTLYSDVVDEEQQVIIAASTLIFLILPSLRFCRLFFASLAILNLSLVLIHFLGVLHFHFCFLFVLLECFSLPLGFLLLLIFAFDEPIL